MEQATIMMGHLHKFTEGSGFVFVLADSEGYVLTRVGDNQAYEFANISNLIDGANWSEQVMGTTAGCLAQILAKPVQLFGYESYCRVTAFTCGSTCPIFDEEDKVIGTLNAAGPYHLFNTHTMGMVVAASRAIERQMALHNAYQQSEMANLYKTTIMESMSEGVLTLDREGRVTHINLIAAQSLGVDYRNSIGANLRDLMLPENELFFSDLAGNKSLCDETRLIRRNNGAVKLAVSCTPLTNKNRKILGTTVILRPIQQYKRLIERVSGARAKITFNDIVGQSSELKLALKFAEIAAKSSSNVLLLGESGVGKEMFAQAIHNASNRSKEPFFAINCAALPRELISSELFGYEEGAFTGARKGGNPGKFELADQGTIFLDEIGEMPLDLQGLLLRFLEEGTLVRLGGKEIIPVDVRIIAATNKNLLEEVKKGNFRLDLYYRLEVINIKIPPLRERKDDIPRLVEHLIKTIAPKLGKEITHIGDNAMNMLLNYEWPGNVRELNNVIERAINLAEGNLLTLDAFALEVKKPAVTESPKWRESFNKDLMEAQLIKDCLLKNNGSKTLAAKELGMSRSSIYRKMLKYSL
jgi:transcriptional regulator with PAS, ATPase and Fis domain